MIVSKDMPSIIVADSDNVAYHTRKYLTHSKVLQYGPRMGKIGK